MTNVSKCYRTDCACNINGECKQASGIKLDKDGICTSFEAKQSEKKGVIFENDDPLSHVLPMSTLPDWWND
ncbi:MAG: hypothetical protein J6X14_00895 [Lachnospiraceae bacterium]|nr:hypothetical protein [Lachnospiraceae bacterium]